MKPRINWGKFWHDLHKWNKKTGDAGSYEFCEDKDDCDLAIRRAVKRLIEKQLECDEWK